VGKVERRLRLNRRLRRCRPAAPAAIQKIAHLLGFVGFDRTGMCLLLVRVQTECHQSLENGLGLHFQFPRQIVDSNFAHPSLFSSSAALTVHISLIEG
jgi:hypothetical protein